LRGFRGLYAKLEFLKSKGSVGVGEDSLIVLGEFTKPNSFDGNSRYTRYSMAPTEAMHTVQVMKNRISSVFPNPLSREMPKYDSNALTIPTISPREI
jgi:hypothetical protein